MNAGEEKRRSMRDTADASMAPLKAGSNLKRLRSSLLKEARKVGPKLNLKAGTHFFYDREKERGKYIIKGSLGKSRSLFLGLHGGGVGSGEAESMAALMGGGGWLWIFPEVLEKTELGWTTSGTEEFILELIEAAKRSTKVDPNRIYVSGHSMGGYGSWTLGAHHADVFAGAAAYAGGPSPIYRRAGSKEISQLVPGVIPNLATLPLLFFQSLDDPKVTPEANLYANKKLVKWKKDYPDLYNFRYVEVNDRGHAPPAEGYLPTQKWVASHDRIARPRHFIWQPVLPWKKHFFWIHWEKPGRKPILSVKANDDNSIDIQVLRGTRKLPGLSVLLGEPLVDLTKKVTIRVQGKEKFRGMVERSFSTLLLTLPRNDPQLLFDARVDLP